MTTEWKSWRAYLSMAEATAQQFSVSSLTKYKRKRTTFLGPPRALSGIPCKRRMWSNTDGLNWKHPALGPQFLHPPESLIPVSLGGFPSSVSRFPADVLCYPLTSHVRPRLSPISHESLLSCRPSSRAGTFHSGSQKLPERRSRSWTPDLPVDVQGLTLRGWRLKWDPEEASSKVLVLNASFLFQSTRIAMEKFPQFFTWSHLKEHYNANRYHLEDFRYLGPLQIL